MKVKRKKPTMSKLKKKLDSVFSQYIRLRDSNNDGYFNCITCEKRVFWKEGHNCHYWPRNISNTRYDEQNCNAGCLNCNLFDKAHHARYARALQNKYGNRILEELELKARLLRQLKVVDYEEMIECYKGEVKQLSNLKGIII
jgi:hypothetical protein